MSNVERRRRSVQNKIDWTIRYLDDLAGKVARAEADLTELLAELEKIEAPSNP